jgi:hypothetical protein
MTIAIKCPICHGDGYTERDVSYGDYTTCEAYTCESCAGKGIVWTFDKGAPPSDSTFVEFEDDLVEWGQLTSADRKAFLAGGYSL